MDKVTSKDQCEDNYRYYEDNTQDSDIESRLYAEIYYSNDIIGESSTSNKEKIEKSTTTVSSSTNQSTNHHVSSESNNDTNKEKNLSNNLTTYNEKGTANRICSESNSSQTQIVNNLASDSTSIEKTQTNKRKSQEFNNSGLKDNTSNTKRKKFGKNFSDCTPNRQENAQNSSINHKANKVQCLGNTIINPFNKQVPNESMRVIQLLSPEFNQIFFKSSKKPISKLTKKNKKLVSKSIGKKKNNSSLQPVSKNNIHEKVVNHCNTLKNTLNESSSNCLIVDKKNETINVQKNLSDTSVVIDISSDSSQDSVDLTSKYNTLKATEEKINKLPDNSDDLNDSASDGDESIYEVPVPPKPEPMLIDLKDSENETKDESDNDCEDSFLNDITFSELEMTHNKDDTLSTSVELNISNRSSTSNPSESEEDSFILNCTGMETGAANLEEIRTNNKIVERDEVTEITGSSNEIQCETQENILNNEIKSPSTLNQVVNPAVSQTTNVNVTVNKSQICTSKSVDSLENYFFKPMNNKMKEFYDKSWGGENFDIESMRSKMSTDSRKWAILRDDIVGLTFQRNKRYFGIVCSRCHKDGHRQNQCTEPLKSPICHMCGATGHFESSCPHKTCLTCGRKQRMYSKVCESCIRLYCSRCRSRGHSENSCPDLWRRYHHTISKNNAETPKNINQVMRPQYEMYCCNCSKKGHDFSECRKLRWSQHFPTPSRVVNYNGPAYILENFHESRIINNQVTSKNSYTSSSSMKTSLHISNEKSMNLNSSSMKTSPHISNEKSMNLNSTLNASTLNSHQLRNVVVTEKKNVIFEIKSRTFDEIHTMKSITVKGNELPNQSCACILENWKYMINFFRVVERNIQIHFKLEFVNNQFQIFLNCWRNYTEFLKRIIVQYVDRDASQRPYMFLEWLRDSGKVLDLLSNKITEMSALNDNPLELYEECKKLLSNSTLIVTSPATSLLNQKEKQGRLNNLLVKLIMILYREGCADDSLKLIKNLVTKINTNIKVFSKKCLQRNIKSIPVTLLQFKRLFQCLYLYNNIFTPHHPKSLNSFITNYEKHVKRRDNIMKNRHLLFSKEKHNTSYQDKIYTQKSLQANNNDLEVSLAGPSANINQSTKNNSVTSGSISFQSNNPANTVHPSLANVKNNKLSKCLRKKQNPEEKLNNFRKKILKLLVTAKKLKSPYLQLYIDAIENKFNNRQTISNKDICKLQSSIKKEFEKRRG